MRFISAIIVAMALDGCPCSVEAVTCYHCSSTFMDGGNCLDSLKRDSSRTVECAGSCEKIKFAAADTGIQFTDLTANTHADMMVLS